MRKSPRTRRLEADFRGIQQLSAESTIFDYECTGQLPELYRFFFHGPGTYKTKRNTVAIRDEHEIVIELAAAYPRLMPGITWQTPVFHPNISSSGVVCLGGYGTNWVPSLQLDELCVMLWDMIRYKNYDVESPYNREAAMWAREQIDFRLPLDDRPLRNRVASRSNEVVTAQVVNGDKSPPPVIMEVSSKSDKPVEEVMVEVVDQPREDNDGIMFLD